MGLSRIHYEGSRSSQEPLDPRVLIWWLRWSLQHYILMGNPIFCRHHQELRNCLPLGCHLQGGGLIYRIKKIQGRRRTRGGALLGPATAGAPCAATAALPFTATFADASFGRAAASPPWRGTSPSSSTEPPHHPYCNLLANMMCGTIYYFHMIYCVYVYIWVVIVHGNCEILCWLVAYMFVIFYNDLMYWYMIAHICWGDA
jgi:hypothetical protein